MTIEWYEFQEMYTAHAVFSNVVAYHSYQILTSISRQGSHPDSWFVVKVLLLDFVDRKDFW